MRHGSAFDRLLWGCDFAEIGIFWSMRCQWPLDDSRAQTGIVVMADMQVADYAPLPHSTLFDVIYFLADSTAHLST